MTSILERIEELRTAHGLMDKDMCQKVNIKQSTYSTWKQKDRQPDVESLIKFADYFNVSLDYLMVGTEKDVFSISDSEEELILAFRSLNEPEKEMIKRSLGINDIMETARAVCLKYTPSGSKTIGE